MPIQPLAPTRRLNSGLWPSPCTTRAGSNVPAATSWEMNARTSRRSASHSGGRRIGSKRSSALMMLTSARRHQGPQLVGAAPGYEMAELDRPVALAAEIVAPGQEPQRVAVQNVLLGEADRAVYLMGDGDALLRRLATADFRRRRLEEDRFVERMRVRDRICRRPGRRDRSRHL